MYQILGTRWSRCVKSSELGTHLKSRTRNSFESTRKDIPNIRMCLEVLTSLMTKASFFDHLSEEIRTFQSVEEQNGVLLPACQINKPRKTTYSNEKYASSFHDSHRYDSQNWYVMFPVRCASIFSGNKNHCVWFVFQPIMLPISFSCLALHFHFGVFIT